MNLKELCSGLHKPRIMNRSPRRSCQSTVPRFARKWPPGSATKRRSVQSVTASQRLNADARAATLTLASRPCHSRRVLNVAKALTNIPNESETCSGDLQTTGVALEERYPKRVSRARPHGGVQRRWRGDRSTGGAQALAALAHPTPCADLSADR